MTDRVCPGCGKSVLSVATRCPRCGHAFETRYDRHIDPKPLRPKVPGPALIVIAIVVVVAANLLWKSGRGGPRESLKPSATAPATPPAATVAAAPAPATLTAKPESTTVRPPLIESVPAPKTPVVAKAVAPAAPAPVAPAAEPVLVTGAERRFATTWINVRAVRSNTAKVVRVLKPGEAVQVDSLGQGWYKVVSGEPGYADRRLLASAPPARGD